MPSRVFVLVPVALVALAIAPLGAQEKKPVPKDSIRVSIPGCSKGMVFTAGARTEDQPGGSGLPEGTHLRMNGPKKLLAEIKGQEGSRVEITGLVRKGQYLGEGVRIAPGVRITAGDPTAGGMRPDPGGGMMMIDVEGWRHVAGDCPAR